MIKKFVIYDLDGTVINSLHRYRTNENNKIDLEYWRKNDTPDKIMQDSLMQLANRLVSDIANPEIYVVIATARACELNDANYAFIAKYIGKPNKFIHRQGQMDTRGGAVLKIQAIRPLLNLRQFKNAVVHVYEDNIDYLQSLCYAFRSTHKTVGHFSPSYQGH